MVEVIKCKCKKCHINYQRPITLLLYHLELLSRRGTEFSCKRRLEYCDKCVVEKEMGMLKNLGKVIEALANN